MSAAGYEGAGFSGAGGKFRKQPFRRDKTTPYDRPATALRPSLAAVEKNGWLSKLVDPASRLITYGAHKLFSSVFRKRLLPPPTPTKDDSNERRDVLPEAPTTVVQSGTKEPATSVDNDARKVADCNGVVDLEAILKQKTFTRSEIDHLTTLLLSKTVDDSFGAERGMSEPKMSDLRPVFDGRLEKPSTLPIRENGMEHAVPRAISTPATRLKALEEEVASPAELAKAYMGSRSARVSPSGFGLQIQMPREESPSLYNQPFKLRSPATSLLQKPANDVGTSQNGFVTPRFRGRSAIYNMARTPYSRMHPTAALKAADTHGGSSLSNIERKQSSESNKQASKRRISVLENDIGSVGPIRRIRQKPNLLHPKTLTLPTSSVSRAAHGSGPLLDVSELPSSSGWSSHSHSFSKSIADNNKPTTSSDYVPSQSIEMAQKIFEQLDKFTPKGKSSDIKFDIGVGSSSSKMTPVLSGGLPNRNIETLDQSKVLQSIQDSKKENGLMISVDAHGPLLKTTKTAEEISLKKLAATSDNLAPQNGAEVRGPVSFSSHENKINVVSHCDFDRPQKKRAFQMSAHEDYLELDEDAHVNGVASMPSGEGLGSAELPKKSATLCNSPLKEAIAAEKPLVSEPKPSNSLFGLKEESPAYGPLTTNSLFGFTSSVASSTSPSSTMGTAAITMPNSTENFDKVAPQNEVVPAFKPTSAKLSPFSFSTSSFVTQSAVQDAKAELPSSAVVTPAKANGPGETFKKTTQEFVDGLKNPEDVPLPVISSAKGIFNFGSPANSLAATNALSSPLPMTSTSSSGLFSNISSSQSGVPVSAVSSPPPFSGTSGLSNGFLMPTSTSGTATVGTMVGTATTSNLASLSASSIPIISSSVTVTSVSSGPAFQFGSSVGPSTSATFGTSASFFVENSGSKSVEITSTNTTSNIFGAKSSETSNGGSGISGFNAPTLKASTSEAPAATGSIFGFQSTSAASLISTSTHSFPSQFASSPAFGSSGGTELSSGASLFGSAGPTASPFSSVSASASSSLGISSITSSVTSSSGSASNIFGSSWEPPKSTFPSSTFGTPSQPTGFSFGAATNGSSTDVNKSSSAMFGSLAAPSSSSASSSPFVFGSSTSLSSSSASASGSPFVFGTASSSAAPVFSFSSSISAPASSSIPSPSQPVFGNNSSTPTFAFGSTLTPTPSGNNEQMSMEDSMAMDSMHAPTAAPAASVFGQLPMSAPSGGFVFGGAPSPSPSSGFMGVAAPQPTVNPFQFGNQPPNQMPAQGLSAFQPSGSAEFHGGSTGSFSLGTGGGDKANRRIIKPKSKVRRK